MEISRTETILKSWISNKEKFAVWGGSKTSIAIYLDLKEKYQIENVECIFDNLLQEKFIDVNGENKEIKKIDSKNMEYHGEKILLCIMKRGTCQKIMEQLYDLGLKEGEDYLDVWCLSGLKERYEECKVNATYAPWRADDEFLQYYNRVKNNTLVDIYRCYNLWLLVAQAAKNEEGDFLEVGVWRGGTGALIAKRAELLELKSDVYLCDTFTGVVKVQKVDTYYKNGGHSDTTEEIVKELLNDISVNNVQIVRGIFPDDSMEKFADKKFCMVHIDVDIYQSGKDVWNFVYPRLVSGGIVVFDDYGFLTTPGITRLVEEIARENKDVICTTNLNGEAVIIKK